MDRHSYAWQHCPVVERLQIFYQIEKYLKNRSYFAPGQKWLPPSTLVSDRRVRQEDHVVMKVKVLEIRCPRFRLFSHVIIQWFDCHLKVVNVKFLWRFFSDKQHFSVNCQLAKKKIQFLEFDKFWNLKNFKKPTDFTTFSGKVFLIEKGPNQNG